MSVDIDGGAGTVADIVAGGAGNRRCSTNQLLTDYCRQGSGAGSVNQPPPSHSPMASADNRRCSTNQLLTNYCRQGSGAGSMTQHPPPHSPMVSPAVLAGCRRLSGQFGLPGQFGLSDRGRISDIMLQSLVLAGHCKERHSKRPKTVGQQIEERQTFHIRSSFFVCDLTSGVDKVYGNKEWLSPCHRRAP